MDKFITPQENLRGLDLSPNGFYLEVIIRGFPLCDRKVLLHVSRRAGSMQKKRAILPLGN